MPTRLEQTTITLLPELRDKLEDYKESNESWDDFIRKVLLLIEKDIENSI